MIKLKPQIPVSHNNNHLTPAPTSPPCSPPQSIDYDEWLGGLKKNKQWHVEVY
jgi:hypothetical protein